MENKADSLNYQRLIFMGMAKYEERSYHQLNDRPEQQLQPMQRMLVGGLHNQLTKDFNRVSEQLQNPFSSVFYWVKGQVNDVKAMRDALVSRDNILSVIHKIKSKRVNV